MGSLCLSATSPVVASRSCTGWFGSSSISIPLSLAHLVKRTLSSEPSMNASHLHHLAEAIQAAAPVLEAELAEVYAIKPGTLCIEVRAYSSTMYGNTPSWQINADDTVFGLQIGHGGTVRAAMDHLRGQLTPRVDEVARKRARAAELLKEADQLSGVTL